MRPTVISAGTRISWARVFERWPLMSSRKRGGTADPFRPAHLAATCLTLGIDVRSDAALPGELVRCDLADSVERWTFNSTTGLVDRLDATSRVGPTTTIIYDDYRRADGLVTPFRERIVVPGATVTIRRRRFGITSRSPRVMFAKPTR